MSKIVISKSALLCLVGVPKEDKGDILEAIINKYCLEKKTNLRGYKKSLFKTISRSIESHKKVEKPLISIEQRKEQFKNDIALYKDNYTRDILNQFYSYWTELNITGTKMRFELEKTWSVSRRLGTFKRNAEKFDKRVDEKESAFISKKKHG